MKEAEIRELVGELIVAGFDGTEVTDHAQRLIEHHRVKNIILFKRNVASAPQIAQLNASLQAMARQSGQGFPLIICTDQENGIVRRVAPGIPGLPGNMALGATGHSENAYEIGVLTAKQLLALGVNMDLAPVLDVNNNAKNPVIGVRSYGEDPDLVAEFGSAMIQGLQEHGVIACGKHFPGHGDTSVDSHLALPEIAHSLERLQRVELKPFLKAMEVGVDVLMTAHVMFPSIEAGNIPATLSKAVLTDFLRGELGYQGVITTDCLEMNAISETVGVAEGAVQALLAGADFLMISHRLDRQEAAIEGVVKAVLNGRVPEGRLIEAATRVRQLRQNRVGRFADESMTTEAKERTVPSRAQSLDSLIQESNSLQKQICAQAATIVANRVGLIPVDRSKVQTVSLLMNNTVTRMVASDNSFSYQFVVDALRETFPDRKVQVHQIDNAADTLTLQQLENASLIVAGIHGTPTSEYLQLVHQLAEQGRPVVAVALQSPYDLQTVAWAPTQVAIYEYTPWMVEAGIHALIGDGGTGRLPVTL